MAENKRSCKGLVITLVIFMVAFATFAALLFTGVVKSPLVKWEKKTVEKTSTRTDDDTKKSSTTEKTADERYKEYITNLAASIKKNYVSDHVIPEGGYESNDHYNSERFGNASQGFYAVGVTSNLELVYSFNDKKDVKIADNVVSFYTIFVGNGGMKTLYYITTDGVIHSANLEMHLYNGDELKINDLEYKNIVEVKTGATYSASVPIFIDIDGNVIFRNN